MTFIQIQYQKQAPSFDNKILANAFKKVDKNCSNYNVDTGAFNQSDNVINNLPSFKVHKSELKLINM